MGRPITWSGRYSFAVEQAQQRAAERPCPAGCAHRRGEHRERPRAVQAVTVEGGCGTPHMVGTQLCDTCTAVVRTGGSFSLTDVPNPAFEGVLLAYCEHPGCMCRMEVEA